MRIVDEIDESDTLLDLPVVGPLTFREAHAVVEGVHDGYFGRWTDEYDRELHYYKAGRLLGHSFRDDRRH